MELKNFFAQDSEGNILGEATCYLYQRGTESLAVGLKAATGVAIANPFITDVHGRVEFAAPDGLYDLRVIKDARDYRFPVQCLDVAENVATARAAADKAQLARDAASLSAGLYPTAAAGLAATLNGKYFSVPVSGSDDFLILYRNAAGVASEQGRYSSAAATQKVASTAKRGNYQVLGRLSKVDKVVASFDHLVSWNRLYVFRVAGNLPAYVQAVTDLYVPDGHCAYVDLNEAPVNSEYLVHVSAVTLGSIENPAGSYIEDGKLILFTCLNGILGGALDPQYHMAAAGTVLRSALADATRNATDRSGWHVVGKATKMQPLVSTPSTYSVSFPELLVTGGLTAVSKRVAPVTSVSVASGEAIYVDLDSAPNESGQLVPQVTAGGFTIGMLSSGTFVSDRKVYLFINNANGIGGPLAQQVITPDFVDTTLNNRGNRASYQLIGDLSKFLLSGTNCVMSFGELRITRGIGNSTFVVAGMTDVTVPRGQAIYVDLSAELVGGMLVPQLTTGGYSTAGGGLAPGAFVNDNKLYLFINDALGFGGALANRRPMNAFLGEVWLKTSSTNITFDPATRTLSWDNYLVLPTIGGQGRIRLAPGSFTFTNTTFNVAYLDLTVAVTTGDTPATAVKGGTYHDGTVAERYRGQAHQLPLFYWNGTGDFGSLGGFPRALEPVVLTLAADDLVAKVGINTLSVFVKGAKSSSKKYLEQTIGYENKPFDPSGADAFGNSDLWRLKHGYECDLDVLTMAFTRARSGNALLNGGEIEGAWKEQGAVDYIGGYHGDEIKTHAALFLDGVQIPFNTVATYVGKKMELVQYSKLYKCNTQIEVATHSKRVTITHAQGGMQIDLSQQVVWSQVLVLEAAMMTMLPIKRLLTDTSGDVITHTAMRAPYASTEDVSVTGFPQVATLGKLPASRLWGPTGISASVEILKHPGHADCGFYVANASYYNKFYYSVAGSAVSTMGGVTHTTQPGEMWDVESVIRMTTTN